MTNILLNALASTAGGGLTYLRNVLPKLRQFGQKYHFVVVLPEDKYDEFLVWQNDTITMVKPLSTVRLGKRIWWEQTKLRKLLRQQNIEVLISLGNFAMMWPSIPQILFSRNALYFSPHFTRDLYQRRAWKMLVEHFTKSWLAKLSLRAADYHVVPTAAMGENLLAVGVNPARLKVLPFGFDSTVFIDKRQPLTARQATKLEKKSDAIRLLYVSHYNYFRNFETLLRALPLLKDQLKQSVQLVLTTELQLGVSYGGYQTDEAFALIEQLKLADDIVMLGAVEYNQLYEVYQACDLFVCPSYAESFGHPLLEAISAKLPIVAADLPVHREICNGAAVYFDVFDERQLAAQIIKVVSDDELREKLLREGEGRLQCFLWDTHVTGLIELIETINVAGKPPYE